MTELVNPIERLDKASMSRMQIVVIAITVFLNALDGFDLLSISFAAPGIVAEWGVSRSALGIVLSMELIGMGVGALLFGGGADKFGRRPIVLICLMFMSLGMLGGTFANGVVGLSICRIITGVGIGGILACANAIIAEFSNAKWRRLCISLMVIGFPLGGVLGGFIASNLLLHYEWRSVFYFGAAVTAFLLPCFYFFVPESVHWLVQKQPKDAIKKVNITLKRLGHDIVVDRLPPPRVMEKKSTIGEIFVPKLFKGTMLVTLIYTFHAVTFYFTLKWVPKIVVDMGFHPASAGSVLVWANVGGVFGGIVFGFLAMRYRLKPLLFITLILSALSVIAFGNTPAELGYLSFYCALAGFFSVSAVAGTYAIMAQIYPTHVRAFGTGFSLSVGRGGAVLSPILAGVLFSAELGLSSVSLIMAGGSIMAAFVLLFLKFK